jgi:hypothetical protein
MARPNLAQSFIPVIGPAWEAAADLQEGDYAGAAFNGAMAVVDVLPVGVAAKGARAAARGIDVMKKGSADAARKKMKARGFVPKGHEVHHTIPLRGANRNAQDPRNNFALLKVLPREQHRRLHGGWHDEPRYDPIRRVWYGTTDWQKAVPIGVGGKLADGWENLTQPFQPPAKRRGGR